MYSIATVPLIKKLGENIHQIWYADDATGVGKLADLRRWWDRISLLGPAFGYFPNADKLGLSQKETTTWLPLLHLLERM